MPEYFEGETIVRKKCEGRRSRAKVDSKRIRRLSAQSEWAQKGGRSGSRVGDLSVAVVGEFKLLFELMKKKNK